MPLQIFQPSAPLAAIKFVIAIAAGKGGVGKSSVTVNLALALQAQGFAVGIMDTDIYGPSIRKMLPEDRLPSQKGEVIQPALCSGIKMISMAYFRKDHEATAVRAPIANGLISQFIKNVAWGNLDFLLIDFPPGTGDIQLTLSQQANLTGAIMVTTPQEVAVLDVRKAIHLFEQVKIPILGIVENMSYYAFPQFSEPLYLFGRGGGERLAIEKGVPLLGEIPIDPILCDCGDKGHSLFALDPQHQKPITQAFITLAQKVVMQLEIQSQAPSTLSQFDMSWKEMKP
jgi:ATP-binding protein involved in chromosome partitioning